MNGNGKHEWQGEHSFIIIIIFRVCLFAPKLYIWQKTDTDREKENTRERGGNSECEKHVLKTFHKHLFGTVAPMIVCHLPKMSLLLLLLATL